MTLWRYAERSAQEIIGLRRQNGPTIKDIAAHAGTNRTAVSVVLNGGRSNGGISEATRQRILAAANELHYAPNAVAQSLSQRRSNTLSFYSDQAIDVEVPWAAMIFSGLQKGCAEFKKDLLLHGNMFSESSGHMSLQYRELVNGKIDGIVLLTLPNEQLLDRIRESYLDAVAIIEPVPGVPGVVVDEESGSRMLAEHLASRGHSRVIYHAPPVWQPSQKLRWEGFRAAADAAGVAVTTCYGARHEGPLTDEEKSLLSRPAHERPTAIACFADFAAFEIMEDCERLGMSIPGDVAIVGFDGIRIRFQARPYRTLTTVRVPWKDMAHKAVQLLCLRLAGNEIPMATMLPVELIVGDTT
jgi:DNA-binding LacI/PurR family transcriptional regulator